MRCARNSSTAAVTVWSAVIVATESPLLARSAEIRTGTPPC